MMISSLLRRLALLILAIGGGVEPALAVTPVTAPTAYNAAGQLVSALPVFCIDLTNAFTGCTGSGGGSVPTGTAGSPNSSVLTVQGISGGTAQPVTVGGTLPGYAVTPTFNIGTLGGGATAAGITTLNTTLSAQAKAEDSASADGDVGVPSMCVRQATPANSSGSDGDYEVCRISGGLLWVQAVQSGTWNDIVTGNTASGAADSGNPVKVGCVFSSVLPSLAAGQRADAQCDNNGFGRFVQMPSASSFGAITPVISSSAAATSLVAKASSGSYYDGYCQSSAAGRCILYNATTVPSAGALTASLVLECAIVPAGGEGSWAYGSIPRRASVGIVILMSTGSDCNTYTASSTAYIHASVL